VIFFVTFFLIDYHFLTLTKVYLYNLTFFVSQCFHSTKQPKEEKLKSFLYSHFFTTSIKRTPRVIEFTMVGLSCTKY